MFALFLVINKTYLIEDIHEVLYDCGVGATTFDSTGLGKVLLNNEINITVFTSIRKILEGNKPYNKTIISVIRSEEKLDKVIKALHEKIEGITDNGAGFMFVVPVVRCYGFNLEKCESEALE